MLATKVSAALRCSLASSSSSSLLLMAQTQKRWGSTTKGQGSVPSGRGGRGGGGWKPRSLSLSRNGMDAEYFAIRSKLTEMRVAKKIAMAAPAAATVTCDTKRGSENRRDLRSAASAASSLRSVSYCASNNTSDDIPVNSGCYAESSVVENLPGSGPAVQFHFSPWSQAEIKELAAGGGVFQDGKSYSQKELRNFISRLEIEKHSSPQQPHYIVYPDGSFHERVSGSIPSAGGAGFYIQVRDNNGSSRNNRNDVYDDDGDGDIIGAGGRAGSTTDTVLKEVFGSSGVPRGTGTNDAERYACRLALEYLADKERPIAKKVLVLWDSAFSIVALRRALEQSWSRDDSCNGLSADGLFDDDIDPWEEGGGGEEEDPTAEVTPLGEEYDDDNLEICAKVKKLRSSGNEIIFQHIFAHCGLAGNIEADRLAAQGCGMTPNSQPHILVKHHQ